MEASKAFFDRLVWPIDELREAVRKHESYDEDWAYTWNPLEDRPLIGISPQFPERVVCPIPRYLVHRASSGIFYDIVKTKGFDNPYGDSFEAYVGDVLHATCPASRFAVISEEPYSVARSPKHGVDWVLSDNTGHLIIEAKTKRLTLDARMLADAAALNEDLMKMAEYIVQHYKNIKDVIAGMTGWKPNGLPIYPLVLTLEDWHLVSPVTEKMLSAHVHHLLEAAGIPEQVLDDMPYTIASSHEFEMVIQVIAQVGIASVMTKKTVRQKRHAALWPVVRDDFPDEMRAVNMFLFPESWRLLVPAELHNFPMGPLRPKVHAST